MEKPENQHVLPAALVGQTDVLFGNLHELFTFHQDVFLKDLERSISATELVALCFVEKVKLVNTTDYYSCVYIFTLLPDSNVNLCMIGVIPFVISSHCNFRRRLECVSEILCSFNMR